MYRVGDRVRACEDKHWMSGRIVGQVSPEWYVVEFEADLPSWLYHVTDLKPPMRVVA